MICLFQDDSSKPSNTEGDESVCTAALPSWPMYISRIPLSTLMPLDSTRTKLDPESQGTPAIQAPLVKLVPPPMTLMPDPELHNSADGAAMALIDVSTPSVNTIPVQITV